MPRCFVAIRPPEAVQRALAAVVGGLALQQHRPAITDHIHLTLLFVGDTGVRELDHVCESVTRSAAGLSSFALTVDRGSTFPRMGTPRLFAAITDQPPTLLEIRDRLVRRLAKSARVRSGDHFEPHLTLARFEPGMPRRQIEAPIPPLTFDVHRIVLYESILHPSGAEHRPVLEVPLLP